MGGDDRHGVPDFNPILIGLMGIIAGYMMVATYHCISLGCCFHRRAQAHQQRNMRQISMQNIHHERPSSTSTSSTTSGLIPVVKYSKERNEETCSVCLCEFKEGEQVRVLPECLHLFHVACIDMWLSSHSNCPLCRADATTPPHVVLSLPDSGDPSTPEVQRVSDFGV